MSAERTIAITGASGMLGRALCERFALAGWRVRALVRDAAHAQALFTPGISMHACDLPGTLDERALDGAGVVIHAAYTTRFRNLDDARRTNEDGTRAVADAAQRAAVPRFVFISSIAAQERARSYYGQSKLALERELTATLGEERVLHIRPGLVLSLSGGLFARIAAQVRRARLVPVVAGGAPNLQPIHIADLLRAIDLALAQGRTGPLTLALPAPVTYAHLVKRTAAHSRRAVVCMPLPGGAVLRALRAAERVGVHLPFSSENLLGLLGQQPVDTRADLARIGLQPRSLEESLTDLLGL